MNKLYLASLATFLVWAGVTVGQDHEVPTLPPPQKVPAPVQEPAAPLDTWEGITSAVFGEPGLEIPGGLSADIEYVLWFLGNAGNSMPIASTDIPTTNASRVLATLGDAEHARRGPASGARFALGYWDIVDNPWVPGGIRALGAEGVFFFVGQRSTNFMDLNVPTIVRPFFDLNNRRPSGFIVAAPGLATGGLKGHARADLWGAEANVWKNVYYDDPGTTCSVSVMAGFRYLDLDYRLDIESISVFNRDLSRFPGFGPLEGNTLGVSDSFATHNRFYGPQVGIQGKWWIFDKMTIEGGLKYALGATTEELNVAGSQLRTLRNGTQIVSRGGLLALPSNIGTHRITKFAQVPELSLKFAAPLTRFMTFSTGFSALYWSKVLRPGDQIERDLDITQIPNFPPGAAARPTGLSQPGVPLKQSDLWLLGISFGVELTW